MKAMSQQANSKMNAWSETMMHLRAHLRLGRMHAKQGMRRLRAVARLLRMKVKRLLFKHNDKVFPRDGNMFQNECR